MYLHLGQNEIVSDHRIIGIFDLDNSSTSKHTLKFLSEAEKRGEVIDVSGDLPKSYVITEEFGLMRVYLTQYNAAVLEKRLDFHP